MNEQSEKGEAHVATDGPLDGHVALITGAASGMGRAAAQLFAHSGAAVAAVDVAPGVAQVAEVIGDSGGTARSFTVDLANRSAIEPLVTSVAAALGPVDLLINVAGISVEVPLDSPDFETVWDRTFAVNLTAQALLVRACLPYLGRHGRGRIVNVASTEGLGATARLASYTASKHAVVGLTRSLAVELGPLGVTVNCVCPGPIHTGMTAAIPDDAKTKFARRRVPLRRYGAPEEVAHMILSLALPGASYVNGAVVTVDGGMLAQNT